MPSLQDTLSTLAEQSRQISQLSSYNDQPRGPFLEALLRSSVLSLIREAEPKEERLFKFVGEEGGGKRVEKRDGGMVTPLKKVKVKGKEVENVEVMLRTALRLVDDYGPMPRARSHIKDLIRAHDQQVDRIAELDELIEEARRPTRKSPRPSPGPAKLDIDEIIKAEEDALKALESSVAAMRRRSPSPERFSPASKAPRWSVAQTPGKTPVSSRQISNSLVSGQTPRRPTHPSRFSPLKLLTTPRVQKGRKSIFGRQAVRPPTSYTIPEPVVAEEEVGDETIRIVPPREIEETPEEPLAPVAKVQTDGVDYDSSSVRDGIAKIESTMGELLGQQSGAKNIIQHLVHLSQSTPEPPSPSSSTAAPSQTLRITPTTILTAHLLLILLRSPDGTAVMNEIKEKLGAVSQAKGWTEGDLGTKVVYQAMGKRCVKIDRRGGNGGKVSFAV